MKKFKIILPEQEIDEKETESKNRANFSKDLAKGGLLAKSLIFTYMNQPVSTTEITKLLNDYYKMDYDRSSVFRALQKLSEKHIIATTTTGTVMHLPEGDRSEIHKKVVEKYYAFLHKIPTQFQKKFQNINYFWVSNGLGTKYIEWCCKLLNFKIEGGK